MIKAWYDVWCDQPDCGMWISGGVTTRDARAHALFNGWKYRPKDGWCCPSCQEKVD